MAVFTALLRGINVGGNVLIPMAELRVLFEEMGFAGTRTLLASGNVVFKAARGEPKALGTKIAAGVRKRFDREVGVVVRTIADLERAVARNPFADAAASDPSHLLIMFLAGAPDKAGVRALNEKDFAPERLSIDGDVAYLFYPGGIARSKLAAAPIERLLKVQGTARNWNTVGKLIALGRELAG